MSTERVTVVASKHDPFAVKAIRSFIGENGIRADNNSDRRPRLFREHNNGAPGWLGSISYGEEHRHSIAVDVRLVDAPPERLPAADWRVVSSGPNAHNMQGWFTTASHRIARILGDEVSTDRGSRYLVLNSMQSPRSQGSLERNAANHLGMEITNQGIFRPDVLAFPHGIGSRHFQVTSAWLENQQPINLISGCCLHADESRTGIVEALCPEITNLFMRTAQAAFAKFDGIHEWYIYTFGEQDLEFLGELGITKVLLPYMWDAPRDKVRRDLAHNYAMTVALGEELNRRLPFSVVVGQLSDRTEKVDIPWLVQASQERARLMLPRLEANPPLIFKQLPTREDRFYRVQQEAFLYLLDTIRFGQCPGEERPATLYVGLEVHGGYWEHGDLFNGPRGEFLPLCWFPQCVRQHWGPWVLRNPNLAKERQRLDATVKHLGF